MKLIIVGSTDILGAELVKQALANIKITSIIAISGRPTDPPQEPSGHSKMVTCELPQNNEGWNRLTIDASATGACIWNLRPVATGPKNEFTHYDRACYHEEIEKGVKWMARRRARFGNPNSSDVTPVKFIYVSSSRSRRPRMPRQDPTSLLIQGITEVDVLSSAGELNGQVQACIAKPRHIVRPKTGNGLKEMAHTAGSWVRDGLKGRLPRIQAETVAAALLDQAITGQHQETLHNRDLIRIGERALKVSEELVTGEQAEQTSEQAGETGEQEDRANKQANETVQIF
ncbi:uncharacterized protein EAF01_009226 [Botrytis porri]|uniref:NAD(P)-binding domain-containing protein n=1 Tax=Botrytis porri TaxID=87229 RepID=A0A4Z1L1V1_9HELO|nr:uncharacterized protein EAF01_009226 [Botrytis porri]KAF7896823.1 hypothetical protein EAF01_009226 [Botrytis porri]TGO90760.1 hypothetical protein BPOR_0052g00230 [Botrytis porri]